MKSVISSIGTTNFPHIRVGTGTPIEKTSLIEYVIGKLSKEEYTVLEKGIKKAAEAVPLIIKNGIDNSMNIVNTNN